MQLGLERSLSAVPELSTPLRCDRSCGAPASSARTSSSTTPRAQTALPATTTVSTACAATVCQTWAGSIGPGRVSTARPPTSSAPMVLNNPVPCMSGTTGAPRGAAPGVRGDRDVDGLGQRAGQLGHAEGTVDRHADAVHQVRLLPDDDALGRPVVPPVYMNSRRCPAGARAGGRVRGQHLLELLHGRRGGGLAHAHEQPQAGHVLGGVRDLLGQRPAEHHGRGAGIGEQEVSSAPV